jgi:hypothetical protein
MKRLLTLTTLTLLLAACGDLSGGNPPNPTPTTLTLTTCTANVPVTDNADGDTHCTPITITLPND